jgi:three-Cys-motif partner protein
MSEPIDEVGPWTEVKVQIVREYALNFQKIIQSKRSYNFRSVYMDGFAGTGILLSDTRRDVIGGTAAEVMNVQPLFDEYHFIELNPHKVKILREVLGVMDDADDLVRVHRGDCNAILLQELLPTMTYDSYRKGLLFLDPYGLHVDWKVVIAAGRSGCIDLLINFPIMHMNRSVLRGPSKAPPSLAEVQRMNRFWGDESWRDAAYEALRDLFGAQLPLRKKEGNEPIVEAYIRRLGEVAGFKHVSKPLPMTNRQKSPVYYLIGASAAPQGVKLFNGVFRKWRRKGPPIVPTEHDRVD